MENNMNIQVIEMDPNKVYSIIAEAGDLSRVEAMEYLHKVKSCYEDMGIKAVYSLMKDGVPVITINEILPAVKEWR